MTRLHCDIQLIYSSQESDNLHRKVNRKTCETLAEVRIEPFPLKLVSMPSGYLRAHAQK